MLPFPVNCQCARFIFICTCCIYCTLCTFWTLKPMLCTQVSIMCTWICSVTNFSVASRRMITVRQASFQFSFIPPYIWMCAAQSDPTRWKLVPGTVDGSLRTNAQTEKSAQEVPEVHRSANPQFSLGPFRCCRGGVGWWWPSGGGGLSVSDEYRQIDN